MTISDKARNIIGTAGIVATVVLLITIKETDSGAAFDAAIVKIVRTITLQKAGSPANRMQVAAGAEKR